MTLDEIRKLLSDPALPYQKDHPNFQKGGVFAPPDPKTEAAMGGQKREPR